MRDRVARCSSWESGDQYQEKGPKALYDETVQETKLITVKDVPFPGQLKFAVDKGCRLLLKDQLNF